MSRGGRKTDRRHVLCLVFAMEFHSPQDYREAAEPEYYLEYFANETVGSKISESDYVFGLIGGIFNRRQELDELITQTAESWDISRISKMDLAILRLGLYEILYMEEIAHTVAINEAVEIAKEFSDEESSKFINGILGRIVRKLNVNKENEYGN
ncbi:MAG: transcription antitermination factor NusB [Clostridiales bacterium]|jgi:N utilization substance protein B|nr:transcription antitermination factor NusB [Clostridiales bacterium]